MRSATVVDARDESSDGCDECVYGFVVGDFGCSGGWCFVIGMEEFGMGGEAGTDARVEEGDEGGEGGVVCFGGDLEVGVGAEAGEYAS